MRHLVEGELVRQQRGRVATSGAIQRIGECVQTALERSGCTVKPRRGRGVAARAAEVRDDGQRKGWDGRRRVGRLGGGYVGEHAGGVSAPERIMVLSTPVAAEGGHVFDQREHRHAEAAEEEDACLGLN